MKKTIQKFLFVGMLVALFSSVSLDVNAQKLSLTTQTMLEKSSAKDRVDGMQKAVILAKKDMNQHSQNSDEFVLASALYYLVDAVNFDLNQGRAINLAIARQLNLAVEKFELDEIQSQELLDVFAASILNPKQ